jgi:hypothetical protein
MPANVNGLEKFLKSKNLIYLVAIAVISYLLYRYNLRSTSSLDTMNDESSHITDQMSNSANVATPSGPISEMEDYAKVDGGNNVAQGLSNSYSASGALKAEQLLPLDDNTQFSQLNPQGKGPLGGISLLSAGHHLGIDTKGSSMRNSNLQVRSEPPIPMTKVSPWMNSTIEPDMMRPTLEIGNQSVCS